MRESIFRRVDRVKYRREIARDPFPGVRDRTGRQWGCLILIPSLLYGISLSLLRANNEEWFRIIIGWTAPWDDWAKKHIPVISKVSENLVAHGAANQVILAQQVYSVSILFSLIGVMVLGYLLWRAPKHGRLKRRIVYSLHSYPRLYKSKNGRLRLKTIAAMCVLGIPFMSGATLHMYSGEFFDSPGATFYTRFWDRHLSFQSTDLASCLAVSFMYTIAPLMLFFPYFAGYFLIKMCYVNIRQGIRIRKDRARGVV